MYYLILPSYYNYTSQNYQVVPLYKSALLKI